MNNLQLVGTVARTPYYHCTEGGRDLLRVQLRTEHRGKEQLHHCQVWGPLALRLHDCLREDDLITVRGALLYRPYHFKGKDFELPVIEVLHCSVLNQHRRYRRPKRSLHCVSDANESGPPY